MLIPRSLTTNQLAKESGISRRSLEGMRASGTGPKFLQIGSKKGVRYLETDVLDWLQSRRFRSIAEARTESANAKAA